MVKNPLLPKQHLGKVRTSLTTVLPSLISRSATPKSPLALGPLVASLETVLNVIPPIVLEVAVTTPLTPSATTLSRVAVPPLVLLEDRPIDRSTVRVEVTIKRTVITLYTQSDRWWVKSPETDLTARVYP